MIEQKEEIKIRFAVALQKAIKDRNTSLRELAANSGLEYSNVQRASVGKVNLALSTIIALADGLEISPSKLLTYYEKVGQHEITSFKQERKKKTVKG